MSYDLRQPDERLDVPSRASNNTTDVPASSLACSTAYCWCAAKDKRIAELERQLAEALGAMDRYNHERETNKDVACALKQRDDALVEVGALEASLLCDICGGAPLSGTAPCACGGTGETLVARDYFRTQLMRLEQEVEALRKDKERLLINCGVRPSLARSKP